MTSSPRPVIARRGDSAMAGWQALALLGFALITPAALPAGGADRRLPEVRRRQNSDEPLLSTGCLPLRCAPERRAPFFPAAAVEFQVGAETPRHVHVPLTWAPYGYSTYRGS